MTSPERLSADDITWDPVSDVGPDHRDVDVADVAIAALEEAQTYRLLAQQAIHLVHVLGLQLKELRGRYNQVLEQFRNNRTQRTKTERSLRR